MNKIIKRIVSAVTAVAVTLTAVFVFDVPEKITAAAAGAHTHKVCVNADNCPSCSHGDVEWTAWPDDDDLPFRAGNYYLTKDVTLPYGGSISRDINLCLNGYTISVSSGIFTVSAAFTLCDCSSGQTGKITNGEYSVDLNGDGSATFTMYSGNISNFTGDGGVLVGNGNTFTMCGGTISGNNANGGYSGGGGVYVNRRGTFIMYGGKILNNETTLKGGGVSVLGTFTMYGGEISGNTAQRNGGGIYIEEYAEVTLNGKVNITGNKSGTNNLDDNIFLKTGKILSIGNNFSTESKAGITLESDISCGDKSTLTGALSNSQAACFTSDDTGRKLIYEDGVLKLEKPHTWNAGTVTTAATCTATGVKTYTCSVCNATKTETIAATGHSYKTTWSSDGTSHYHECSKCGDKKDTAAHSGGTATCQTKATCTVCGQKYGSLGAHNYSTAWTTSSTQHWHACLTSGCTDKSDTADHTFVQKKDGTNHWQECSVCGYKKDETAHTWRNWTLKTEPTLTTTGTAERACDCGEKQTKTDVPALTDTIWTKSNRTDPTLDGTGSEEYTSTDYGEVTITIPALTNPIWTNISHKDATEEAEGEDVYESADYGTVTVILPALDHTHVWGDWEITKAPTLSEEGTAKHVCTKDDTHIDTKTLPALTDETVWTKVSGSREDPTLKDKGSEDYTSEYGTVALSIPELTDPIWTKGDRTDPTLDGTGSEKYTSTDYGEVTITIPKLTDPIWTKVSRTDPTLDGTGSEKYTSTDYGEVTITIPELTDPIWTKVSRTDPTLDDTGSEKYTSTDYGEVTITIPELTDPIWTKVSRTDPTIDDTGSEKYTSTDYGEVTITIPELTDPIWTKSDRTDPTLDDTGSEKYTSTDYGEVTITIPELTDPIWTKVSRTDPTLDDTGSEKYTSTDYGEVTITIPALTDPIWIKDDSKHVEPTEEDTGKDVYISEYGEVEVILPAKEHTHVWGNWTITTEPTLTATGTAKRVCTKNAEHTDTKTLPALTDTSVWTKVDGKHVDPTEDNDGKDVYTSEYGEVTVILPALGHTHEWGDWSITVNPTLTETGTAQRVCTLNNTHIDTKTLPALTDTSVWTKVDDKHVDPTDDNDGKDVYTSEYGEVTVILPALGHTHNWGDWSITVNPTLTETGTAQRVCTLNNTHIDTKTLPALTDTSVWTKADDKHVDPTEDNDGKDVYTSEYGEVTVILPALGHTHEWSGEWSKDDTYHWHDCLKNCGEKKDNAAHIWDGSTVTKQPAADAEGEKTFECTVCGKTKTETLPPKDEPSDPDSGNISVDVQPEGNAPDTELKTPFDELADAVLTPEEQENIKNGVDIKIILIVSDATESVPTDDKAKVEAAIRGLSGYKLGQYLDLNLLKIIGDSDGIRITQTNKPITVAFEIPEDLRGKAVYSVIRVHGGETEVLRDLDSDFGTVTIETDKFSTYTLVYKEKSTPSNPGGGSTSGGNSGDSPNPPSFTPGESDNSDDTPSDDNPSRDDSSDTTSSESKPTDEDNSDVTSSGDGNAASSDDSNTTSSDDGNAASSNDGNTTSSESDTLSNVSDRSPSESGPSEDNGNPSTGIAVSLIPLVTAVAVLTAASKRKRNK